MLQWLNIADLIVDSAYQRPIVGNGRRNVDRIARSFSWACFAPVVVSLPAPGENETLKAYFADRLAAGEIVANGLDDGKSVVIARIGETNAGRTLDAAAHLGKHVENTR